MDEAALLQELKDVSNRRSESNKTTMKRRSSLTVTCLSSEIDGKGGGIEKDLSKNEFLNKTDENRELNQYWYSKFTIEKLCDATRESLALSNGKKVAFLSTPSLFFSLTSNERKDCALFDLDKSFGSCGTFYHYYDFKNPTDIDNGCRGQFDLIVIDPPFISQSVWEKYAITAKLLMKNDKAHVIATTVEENAVLMKALFDCKPVMFRPSIPHLVYQYSVFTNFPSSTLADKNEELTQT